MHEKREGLIGFGEFTFDSESDELFCGKVRVPLQPKPARLLGLFLSRPGRLLTAEEMTSSIWPDSVVDYEQRIRSMVREIRSALGDDAENPRYIATVARRGYRFIHPLDTDSRASSRPPRRPVAATVLKAAISLAFLVAAMSFAFVERGGSDGPNGARSPIVLAVLPVKSASAFPREGSPAPGLTHELIAEAARLAPESLTVIGRASATKFENSPLPVNEIASQLGADYLLETTLSQAGELTRLTVTLAATDSQRVVWSSRFEGSEDRLQEFEREILAGIASSLLGAANHPGTLSLRQQTSARAYDAYLKGLYFLEKSPREERHRSYAFFQEALDHDPAFAPAYVGLARAGRAAGRPEDAFWAAMEKALQLDETLAEPYYYRAADSFMAKWNWEAAARDFETAIRLDPGRADFHAFYSAFLRASGDLEQALMESELAIAIDPLSEFVFRDLSWLYLDNGDYGRAIEHCQRALRLKLEDSSQDHKCLMLAYLQLDDLSRSAQHARALMVLGEADDNLVASVQALSPGDQLYAYWKWKLDSLTATPAEEMSHLQLAMVLSAMGRTEEALDSLERSLAVREPGLVFIPGDVRLAPLRSEPRFQQVVRAVGSPRTIN